MLKELKIKNIALIDDVDIEFEEKLNVFTGETGAGKSIIIDSLSFLLGARADKSLIRFGETFARVDGIFDVDVNNEQVKLFFYNAGIDIEDLVIISRVMNIDGKNEIRVNGSLITLSMLKSLTMLLVDIYGQNDQLNLLNNKYQLKLLDGFCEDLNPNLDNYKNLVNNLKSIDNQLNELGGDDISRQREIDLLTFQVEEIENANISKEEEDELLDKKSKMQNLEKIASFATDCVNNIEFISNSLNGACSALNNACGYDVLLKDLSDRLSSCNIEIADILDSVKDYNQNLYFDENEFDKINYRIDEYNNLKRKYGKTVLDVLEFYNNNKDKLNKLQNSDFEIEKLKKQKNECLLKIYEVACKLTVIRKECAKKLEKEIVANLQKLGMKNAKICFNFNSYNQEDMKCGQNGCDEVELLFSANKGEELKPLKNVASGGEMSRFMLALKSVIAKVDDMPTMIFDEIDTGISGLMAQAVAEQIASISKQHQVLVITHTPQIASMADNNYLVKKIEDENRTYTIVKKLNELEKVKEIARFLSSQPNSEIALNNAKQLIMEQKEFKNSL